jgi:3-methyladenine DNA glycosylase AlkD
VESIRKTLQQHADKKQAKLLQRFFKTGPGEYAEGDIFIGIKVPLIREVAKKYQDSNYETISSLLKSDIHEERFLALIILISRYHKETSPGKEKIYKLYLKHTKYINNWDLVDVSAKRIVGAFLMHRNKAPLHKMVKSRYLWERRIAVLSTFYFIENNNFDHSLKIARALLSDQHDLIHKAAGWMLREIGKKNMAVEERFLKQHYNVMPRTMLRYAIEKFPENKRKVYLG